MPKTLAIHDVDEWEAYLDDLDRAGRPFRPRKKVHEALHGRGTQPTPEVPRGDFNPSFTGSKHEREWILTYLSPFYAEQFIMDVLRVVKGGKEATVYVCAGHPKTELELLAAKVYRPKEHRTFKNDADYKWGRPLLSSDGQAIRDRRLLKAVQQGSYAGEAASHSSWLAHEFTTMQLLHEQGADVPRPVIHDENAILMEYVGDAHSPAPTLIETRLDRDEAHELFERLMRNVELLLRNDRIHGDLSAYNVLYWEGAVTLIDFPQVIDAYGNPNAFRFLLRDVERLCAYFTKYGVRSDPHRIAQGMWSRSMPDETYVVRGANTKW
jgi:RIO kinase 1